MHLDFSCAGRYAMALARGYSMAHHLLAVVKLVLVGRILLIDNTQKDP